MKKTSRFSKNRVGATLSIVSLALAGCLPGAWAQPTVTTTNLPAYESFATSYTEGENLGGTTSLINWPTGNSASGSSARIFQAAALSYPSLLTEPTNTSRGLRGGTGTGKNRSFFFAPSITNGTVYASFLFNLQAVNPSAPRLFTCLSQGNGTGPAVNAGVYLDTANHLLVGKSSSITALPDSPTTFPLVSSNTYLIVLRYKFNSGSSTNDEVSLWVNPTSLGNNGAVPVPSITSTNGNDASAALTTFNYLSFSSGLNTVVPFYMDEIRIGTNWADVTPTNSIAGNLYTVTGGGEGCVGDNFAVNLSGSDAGVSYLLYTNGVDSGISAIGAGSALNFGPYSQTAVYTILATNTATGGVSWMPGSASITVLLAPTITAQSGSVVTATNTTIQFSATSGNLNIGYRWYRNGSPLSDNSRLTGSDTSLLTISPVLATDAATTTTGYYCVITNACGYQVISSTNALTIQAANNLVWQGTPANTWDIATTANWTNSVGAAVIFNQGDNVVLDDTAQNTTVSLASPYLSPGSITFNASSAMTISGSGAISGANSSLFVNGLTSSSQLIINSANSFGGGTVISNGWLTLGNASALGTGIISMTGTGLQPLLSTPKGAANVGLPGLSVTTDSLLQFSTDGSYAGVVVGPITGLAGKTLTLQNTANDSGDVFRVYHTNFTCDLNIVLDMGTGRFAPYNNAGVQVYNGVISGSGTLFTRNSGGDIILKGANTYSGGTLLSLGNVGVGIDSAIGSGNGPFSTGPVQLDNAGNIGLYAVGGAHTIENSFAYTTDNAPRNAWLVFMGTNRLTLSGTFDLSAAGAITTNRTFRVEGSAPGILSGVVGDQGMGCGIIKDASGALYLDGANTYSGPTTITEGRLAGSGSIAGLVVVQTNGVLGGGSAAAIGTLTVNNNVSFDSGRGFFRVNRAGFQSDKVVVSGSLANTGTGTITITNSGAALQMGDSFTLFNKAVTGGNTMNVTGAGVTWTNKLAVDGSIAVLSLTPPIATNPTNITYSVSGSNLTLSWPADHTGWILQTQTNALNKGLSTNWFDVAGSTAVNQTNIVINPLNGSVFFRLISP